MCGPANTYRPLGGALAVLSPSTTTTTDTHSDVQPRSITADLAFHTPGNPAESTATHARLTPKENGSLADLPSADLHVIIHSTGDLRRNLCDSGLFRHFTMSPAVAVSGTNEDYVEFQLDSPVSLEVSDDGIIGRRVSLCSGPVPAPENMVAQGIVGFNFLRQMQPSL